MRTIDTVLFDLDDTLHDDSAAYEAAARRVAQEIAAERGLDADAIVKAYVAVSKAFWKTLSREHFDHPIEGTRVYLWTEALAQAGVHDLELAEHAADLYRVYRSDNLMLSPGALDLMLELRKRGYKLGIVTNGFAATHHEKIDRLGLRTLVDGVFIADEMGLLKPDPAVFFHACEKLGSEPLHTAMIGDRFDRDVLGAQRAGLFTVLIDVHTYRLPPGGTPPDATVDSIADVLSVLPAA